MSADFLQTVLIAVAAFAAGYYIGRLKVLAELPQRREGYDPLPGPESGGGPLAGPDDGPRPIPRGPAPPTSAGDAGGAPRRTPPRRSSAPPPAAAGLLNKGGDGKRS